MKTKIIISLFLVSLQVTALESLADKELNCWKSLKSIGLQADGWYSKKIVSSESRAEFYKDLSEKLDHVVMSYAGDKAAFEKNGSQEPNWQPPEIATYQNVLKSCNFPPLVQQVKKTLAELKKLQENSKQLASPQRTDPPKTKPQ